MLIYKATNNVNGKVYIGQNRHSLEHRMKVHHRDSERIDTYFYRAIRKYGWDSFSWEILKDDITTQEDLDEAERYYIKIFDSFDNKNAGYNTTSGGQGGYDITEEQKRDRSLRVQGDKNPFSNEKGVFSWKGKHFSEEHKKRLSESLKGIPHPWAEGGIAVINLMTLESFESMSAAAKAYNTCSGTITKTIKDKDHYAHGCKWKVLEDRENPKSVKRLPLYLGPHQNIPVFCPETEEIYSGTEAAYRTTYISSPKIKLCCSGKLKSYNDHHFRYCLRGLNPFEAPFILSEEG